jgi:cytidyltransferase-like protein
VIVSWNELPALAGQVVMTDGSFDPLHDGHIAYLKAAEEIGYPVLCNIATDTWTATKHPVLLPQVRRAAVVDAVRYVSYVHCATTSTAAVLLQLKPAVYVKGQDWLDRGGIPNEELAICNSHRIQIAYLDTVKNSSSRLINELRRQ